MKKPLMTQAKLEQLLYKGMIAQKEGLVAKQEEIKQKKLHLNISKRINSILEKTKFFSIPTPIKNGVKAILEIFSNLVLLSVAGSFVALFCLLLFPFPESMELVWIVKHNLVVSIVVVFLGSGSCIYLLYDLVELFRNKNKEGKIND